MASKPPAELAAVLRALAQSRDRLIAHWAKGLTHDTRAASDAPARRTVRAK
jgi:hypothetical protein